MENQDNCEVSFKSKTKLTYKRIELATGETTVNKFCMGHLWNMYVSLFNYFRCIIFF